MLLRKMEEFQQLSFKEKNEFINRLAVFPAVTVIVWVRKDVGKRLLDAHAGVMCLILYVGSLFAAHPWDRGALQLFTTITLLLSMRQRYLRWREFRRGIKQHSYYLGTGGNDKTPAFLRRNRRLERLFNPLATMVIGALIFAGLNLQVLGAWLIFAGFCLAGVESWARDKEFEEQQDLVDGMVKAEVQTETVERFCDPAPAPAHQQQAGGSLSTGLGSDIRDKIKRRR